MQKKVFIWVGHPAVNSFCSAIGDAYQEGAVGAGADLRRMNLSDMYFDASVQGALEPDLTAWQRNIMWANHLLFIHPTRWGSMPAKAKAVLDRALAPEFAFRSHKDGRGWDKLLTGKTADAVITSDASTLKDTLLHGRPGRRAMKNQIMRYCGIRPKHIVQFGAVKQVEPAKIESWLLQVRRLGTSAASFSSDHLQVACPYTMAHMHATWM